jgi:hypothetical protein
MVPRRGCRRGSFDVGKRWLPLSLASVYRKKGKREEVRVG